MSNIKEVPNKIPKSGYAIVESIRAVLDAAFDEHLEFVSIEYKKRGNPQTMCWTATSHPEGFRK